MVAFRSISWIGFRDTILFLAVWGLAYVLNIYFAVQGRYYISWYTHALIIASVFSFVLVRILGEIGVSDAKRVNVSDFNRGLLVKENRGFDLQAFVFLAGMMLAITAVGFRFYSGESDLSLQEIREQHRNADASSGLLTLMSSVGLAFFFFGWVRFWTSSINEYFNYLLISLTALCVFMLARITGGRSELLILLALSLFCLTTFRIASFKFRHLATLAVVFVFLLICHTSYSTTRTFKDSQVNTDSRILNLPEQVPFIPASSALYIPAQLTYAMVSDYFGKNFTVLSTFLESDRGETLFGAYSFAALSSKIQWLSPDDRSDRKVEIDLASSTTGDANNVWATSLRELVVDFGFLGCPVAFLVLGLIMNYCRTKLSDLNIHTVACIGTFLVLSPFTNSMLVRSFELWILAIIAWWGIDFWALRLARKQ